VHGPVLFRIFINDIVDIFGSGLTVKLFADDIKFMPLSMMSMTLFYCKKDLMHFMHGQTFGNFLYKNALFYILVGITLTITIQ